MKITKLIILPTLILTSIHIHGQPADIFTQQPTPAEFVNPIAAISVDPTHFPSQGIQYLVFSNNNLYYCDNNFSLIRDIYWGPTTEIISGELGKYILLIERFNIPQDKTDPPGSMNISIYDYEGNSHLIKTDNVVWDNMNYIERLISDESGNYFEYNENTSTLFTYDLNGKIINKFTLFSNSSNARPAMIDISDIGNVIALGVSRRPAMTSGTTVKVPTRGRRKDQRIITQYKRQSGEPHLFLFDSHGNLIRKMALDEEDVGPIAVGPRGELVLVTVVDIDGINDYEQKTLAFNSIGELIYTLPVSCNRAIITNEIIGYIYFDNNSVRRIEIAERISGEVIMSIVPSYIPVSIIAVDDYPNIIAILYKHEEAWRTIHYLAAYDIYSNEKLAEISVGELEYNQYFIGSKHRDRMFNHGIIFNNDTQQIIKLTK